MALAVKAAQASTVPAPDAVLDDDYGDGESLVLLRPGNPPTPVPVERDPHLRPARHPRRRRHGHRLEPRGGGARRHHRRRSRARPRAARRAGRRTAARDLPLRLGARDRRRRIRAHAGRATSWRRSRRVADGGAAAAATSTPSPPAAGSLIDDSLTYAETPIFKVDGVTAHRRAGARGRGRRAQSGAAADRRRRRRSTLVDRRARHGWCSTAWSFSGGALTPGGGGRRRAARAGAARLHAGAGPARSIPTAAPSRPARPAWSSSIPSPR